MRLIAHRGNFEGPRPELENSPNYIERALSAGFDCEIDLRIVNGTAFLGHDYAEHEVEKEFLFKHSSYLWIHCKNADASQWVLDNSRLINGFWHENDKMTFTTKLFIWTASPEAFSSRTVLVNNRKDAVTTSSASLFGLCGDYVGGLGGSRT